jgi:hypothetical protein
VLQICRGFQCGLSTPNWRGILCQAGLVTRLDGPRSFSRVSPHLVGSEAPPDSNLMVIAPSLLPTPAEHVPIGLATLHLRLLARQASDGCVPFVTLLHTPKRLSRSSRRHSGISAVAARRYGAKLHARFANEPKTCACLPCLPWCSIDDPNWHLAPTPPRSPKLSKAGTSCSTLNDLTPQPRLPLYTGRLTREFGLLAFGFRLEAAKQLSNQAGSPDFLFYLGSCRNIFPLILPLFFLPVRPILCAALFPLV